MERDNKESRHVTAYFGEGEPHIDNEEFISTLPQICFLVTADPKHGLAVTRVPTYLRWPIYWPSKFAMVISITKVQDE